MLFMKYFLKPTKVKIVLFLIFVILNVSIPFIWFGSWISDVIIVYQLERPAEYFQLDRLAEYFENLGFKTSSGGDYIPNPTLLGWILIFLSVFPSLIIHYLLSCVFVYLSSKIKRQSP